MIIIIESELFVTYSINYQAVLDFKFSEHFPLWIYLSVYYRQNRLVRSVWSIPTINRTDSKIRTHRSVRGDQRVFMRSVSDVLDILCSIYMCVPRLFLYVCNTLKFFFNSHSWYFLIICQNTSKISLPLWIPA